MSRIGRKADFYPCRRGVQSGGQRRDGEGPEGYPDPEGAPQHELFRWKTALLTVIRPDDAKENRALHGLTRSLVSNMVIGVTEGFKKELDVNGVGYRVLKQGKDLVMNLGYSHQVDRAVKSPASPSRCRLRIKSSSPAPTSSWSASLPPKSARSGLRNPIRARASNMSTRSSAARKARPAARARSKEE